MSNVVLVMSDEHNPRFSCTYGHPFVATPNLDRLAVRGTVYESAYCPSPLCVPSRSAFMSGRWVHEIQRYNNCKVIEGRYPSYGAVLDAQGVHSAYLGPASNLYRDPHDLGFSELQQATATRRPLAASAVRSPDSAVRARRTTATSGPQPDAFAADEAFTDRAVQWLHETAPSLDRPWTVTINLLAPHPPYVADPEHWERYAGHDDLPELGTDHPAAQDSYSLDLRAYGGWDYPESLVRALRRGYYGAVSHVDDQLGRVLDAVEQAGLADDTVIIYTTDHGEMLGRYGIWGKCSLVEDSIRVPVVAAGPGFAAGERVTTPVSLLDVQAALFHAVDAQRPEDWHGEPLQTLAPHDTDRSVFVEYHGAGTRDGGFVIRRGDWKLIHRLGAPDQLFDLADDPCELRDRSDERPDEVAVLTAELRTFCDPEAVGRDAAAFQRRQLDVIAAFHDRHGPDATDVPWGEEVPGGAPLGEETSS